MKIRNVTELKRAMALPKEKERFEFKQAAGKTVDLWEVSDYCAAISNEGGGSIVLGVTDRPPRKIVGIADTRFDADTAKRNLFEWLRIRVEVYPIKEGKNTAYSFVSPARPVGRTVPSRGKHQMRAGSHLRNITADEMVAIALEAEADFSAHVIDASASDVFEEKHVASFRAGWAKKERRSQKETEALRVDRMSVEELLESGFLTEEGRPTYAGVILAGSKRALRKHLRQAEIIFEYRPVEGSIPYAERGAEIDGFVTSGDVIWSLVNKRNDARPYQEGLFKWSLRAFDEPTIREALCNAVCHRDYRDQGSIFVRQSPLLLEVESPGASVVPIESMLTRSKPRNRRLAEAMERCGLVERSGQGIDLMYEQCVRNSRPLPDWSASDSTRVIVRVRGEVTDPKIIAFFERLSAEKLRQFTGEDFLVVDLIRRKQVLPAALKEKAMRLVKMEVLERSGPGFRLSSEVFAQIASDASEAGATPVVSDQGARMLVLSAVRAAGDAGVTVSELMKFAERTREQVRWILAEHRKAGEVHPRGRGAGARWYAGPEN